MGVEGKVCVITGGGSGIGRGAALMMAGQGARIVVVGRTASKVEAVREEIASQVEARRWRSASTWPITRLSAAWSRTSWTPSAVWTCL